MKKITLTLALSLGLTSLVSAQDLFVSPSSYVYVQDEVIFVNDDIRLDAADSNIYLRDGSQLVQNVDIKNSDVGELSVYQEQAANGVSTSVFEYNYWSSPVGVADNTSNQNRNFDLTNIHDPASAAVNETVSAQYGTTTAYDATATEISSFWVFQAENQNSYYDWVHVGTNALAVNTGKGFTAKGSPNANNVLDFRGRPNTGNITVPISWDGSEVAQTGALLLPNQVQTLTGNPYPSAMDLKRFLMLPNNKVSLDGNIYFWEQKAVGSHYIAAYEGGYAVYAPGTVVPDADYNNPSHPGWADNGSYTVAVFSAYNGAGQQMGMSGGSSPNYSGNNDRRYAAIGQGFMIRNPDGSTAGSGTAIIENSMRLWLKEDSTTGGNGSIFGKNSQSNLSEETERIVRAESHNGIDYQNIINNPVLIPEIRIHTKINDSYIRENLIAFREGTSLDYNKFADGMNPGLLDSDSYILANDNKLAIKSIEYDVDARIPFGIKASNGSNDYAITINKLSNTTDGIEVYLYDRNNDTYTDIVNGTFEVTLEEGTYNDRFEVVFKDGSREATEELIANQQDVLDAFDVFQNNNNALLTVSNPKSEMVKSFTMFDAAGKVIYNEANLGNNTQYTFPTNNLSTGVYIVKLVTAQNFELTKKVSVNN